MYMSVELIAISSFVVAILGGIAHCVKRSNLKECKMCCMTSNCRDQDKVMEEQIKGLNEKIEINEKKINKNRNKLEVLKYKKEITSSSKTPSRDSVFSDDIIMTTEI